MIIYLAIVAFCLCALDLLLNYNQKARLMKMIPGPKDHFIVGNALAIMLSPENSAKIKLQSLLDLTVKRLIKSLDIKSCEQLVLHSKWGIDGASSQNVYHQKSSVSSEDLSTVIMASLVPLKLTESASVEIMKAGRRFADTWKDGIYRFWMCPMAAVNIFHPDDIEIIASNVKHHEKSGLYSLLEPWLGEGLLVSKGIKWQERRKILTPTFHFNILRQFFEVMEENSNHLVEHLSQVEGDTIDIVPVLSEFALQTICETAMGVKLNDNTTRGGRTYKQAMVELIQVIYHRATVIPYYFDFIFYSSPLGRKQEKLLKVVHNFTEKVIKDRTEYIDKYGINLGDNTENRNTLIYKKKKKVAMLDLLITAAKEGLIDKKGIQEEVDTFMFEGHDTTAAGLVFCLMLLANHSHEQSKIRDELYEIFGDSKRSTKVEDLTKMKYLECCIKESLRLYPPVHFISRNLTEPVTLRNYEVPAGVFCHMHIFDLHHREDLYPNPNEFIPERFLPENCIGRHPYAYLPFSAGPRNCIGQKFAIMEMKCLVANVLRNFQLLPVTRPSDLEFVADLILRNNGPVELKCVKRAAQ